MSGRSKAQKGDRRRVHPSVTQSDLKFLRSVGGTIGTDDICGAARFCIRETLARWRKPGFAFPIDRFHDNSPCDRSKIQLYLLPNEEGDLLRLARALNVDLLASIRFCIRFMERLAADGVTLTWSE